MAPTKPTPPRTLTMQRTYEPSRIAEVCLADAYARIVPRPHNSRRAAPSTTRRSTPEDQRAMRRKRNEST